MFKIALSRNEKLIGLLMVFTIVFAGAAWLGGDEMHRQMLLDDATDQAVSQANFLESRRGNLDRILAGRATPEDQALIEATMGVGGTLGYEILGPDGIVLSASELAGIGDAIDERPFWDVVRMGDVHATLRELEYIGGTGFVSDTYVPFVKLGRVLGAIRVHVEATGRANALADQIRNAQLGMMALWLLLGGSGAWAVARSMASAGRPRFGG